MAATIRWGGGAPGARVASAAATIVGTPPGASPAAGPIDLGELDETLAAPATVAPIAQATRSLAAAARTTVLPRRKKSDEAAGAIELRPRFDRMRLLGQGGMGEVALARDNDIRRTVAVKYLRGAEAGDEAALLRFADEIRVVGQLEHPAIVPVYDVGVDDRGQHFLVMKHLQGETMEAVIEKLRSGDPEATKRFTPEHRAHLFLQVLDAMRYAHARGILHRDLKPANIMIGPYGEVTVMDWGIAKPIARKHAPSAPPATIADGRLLETQAGALAGTPLYMSPEQAMGRNDELDERSDAYTLCVVLYEWLVLEHPMKEPSSLAAILGQLALHDYDQRSLKMRALAAGVPCEYAFLAVKGLERDRERRFQSVDEIEAALRDVLAGKIDVQCHITLAKRTTRDLLHWVDRHPMLYSGLFFGGAALAVASLVSAIAWGVAHLAG